MQDSCQIIYLEIFSDFCYTHTLHSVCPLSVALCSLVYHKTVRCATLCVPTICGSCNSPTMLLYWWVRYGVCGPSLRYCAVCVTLCVTLCPVRCGRVLWWVLWVLGGCALPVSCAERVCQNTYRFRFQIHMGSTGATSISMPRFIAGVLTTMLYNNAPMLTMLTVNRNKNAVVDLITHSSYMMSVNI